MLIVKVHVFTSMHQVMNVNDDDVVVVVAYRRQFDFIKIFCLKEMIHCEIYNNVCARKYWHRCNYWTSGGLTSVHMPFCVLQWEKHEIIGHWKSSDLTVIVLNGVLPLQNKQCYVSADNVNKEHELSVCGVQLFYLLVFICHYLLQFFEACATLLLES